MEHHSAELVRRNVQQHRHRCATTPMTRRSNPSSNAEAPAAANPFAMPAPIPFEAPVTSATPLSKMPILPQVLCVSSTDSLPDGIQGIPSVNQAPVLR